MVLKVGLCGQSFAWHASRMRRQTDRRVVTISSRRRRRPSTTSCAWCGWWRNYATWRRGRSRDDSAESSHAKLIGNLALCTYLLPAALREFVNFKGGNSPEEDAAALTLFCLRRSRNSCGHYAQRRSVCLSSSVPQRRERRANPIIKPQLLFSHRQKSIGALLLVRSASSSPPSSILGPQTDLGC